MNKKKLNTIVALGSVLIAIYFLYFDSPKDQPDKEPASDEQPMIIENEEPVAEKSKPSASEVESLADLTALEIPFYASDGQVIVYKGFTVSYNEKHEQANWVAYELTAEEVAGTEKRKDNFQADPQVTTGSATPDDYKKSGYDRGHLAPAADLKWSAETMNESFFMTNMSPQVPGFNRGVWKELEEQVRNWATSEGGIYVVTGGVLEDGLPTIGENQVSVPKFYYKVILDYREPSKKAIAFLMPNQKVKGKDLKEFVVSVDSVEKITGIDFFHKLSDQEEDMLEKHSAVADWAW